SAQLPRVAGPNARTEALAIPIPTPIPALGAATPPPGRTPIGAVATPAPQLAPIQPPLAATPTTLSGTASQAAALPRPRRSMRAVGLGLAVMGVLVVGAVAFVVLNRGQEARPASMAAPPAAPEPPPATVPMSPSMPVPTPPTPAPPPEPAVSPNGSAAASQSPPPAADAHLPSAPPLAVP